MMQSFANPVRFQPNANMFYDIELHLFLNDVEFLPFYGADCADGNGLV